MFAGFIYQWIDNKTGLKYIGRHEGLPTDGYIGSGTRFIVEYNKRPEDFTREILYNVNTKIEDLIAKEEEVLANIPDDQLYYGSNRKYYNQVRNSSGYTSSENPMRNPMVVEQMLKTRVDKGTYKSPWQGMVQKYGYEGARTLLKEFSIGNKNGTGNKGKPKSEEHKRNIAKNRKGGRPEVNPTETLKVFNQYGIKDGAKHLGISTDTFRYRIKVSLKRS